MVKGERDHQTVQRSSCCMQQPEERTMNSQLVCVTGAGGFIGSWVVRELLQRGYAVRGTARNHEDRKHAHLQALDGAERRLSMCSADVLDYNSLRAAFCSCDGVFHVASPVSNDPKTFAGCNPGNKECHNTAADMGVQRPDQTLDESCWSDLEYCKQTQNWYCYGKTVAERTAMTEASKRGVHLVVVAPSMTIGEMLQPTLNGSISMVAKYLMGTKRAYPNAVAAYVDVRDVARAHVLVYEHPHAHGRYLCIAGVLHRSEFVRMILDLFPHYPVTSKCEDEKSPKANPYKFSTQRLQALGLKFTPLNESLYKTVICLQKNGHIPILPHKSAL
ncbi:hypothetical protein ACP4OV_022987 [Aristida adscensionis]